MLRKLILNDNATKASITSKDGRIKITYVGMSDGKMHDCVHIIFGYEGSIVSQEGTELVIGYTEIETDEDNE